MDNQGSCLGNNSDISGIGVRISFYCEVFFCGETFWCFLLHYIGPHARSTDKVILAWILDSHNSSKTKEESSGSHPRDISTSDFEVKDQMEDSENASSTLSSLIVTSVAMQITAFLLVFSNLPQISFLQYFFSIYRAVS